MTINQKSCGYSLAGFKCLEATAQKRYLDLARARNPQFAVSDYIIAIVAANIWMEEMATR